MTWKIDSKLRQILEMEKGAVVKDWGGKIPIALVFANTYHAGMSNLGFQEVYGLLNDQADVVCERFFLPDRDMYREHVRTGTPILSLESRRPLTDFKLAAFSLAFENDYPNVLRILDLAGLAWRSGDRKEGDPLILAGGVTMRLNPEPLADFMDLILPGDGEVLIPGLLRAWREVQDQPLPPKEILLRLARSIPGAYAPALYEAALDGQGRLKSFKPIYDGLPEIIAVARVPELTGPAPVTRVMTPGTEFASTRLVEIGRGCGRGCRFCLAGFEYRPPRSARKEDILAALGEPGVEPERVGLVSPAVGDHPELLSLVENLVGQGREVTVSSLRAETLTPELVNLLIKGGLRSAAIAPEAGSERLRAFINKGLTEAEILDGVQVLAEAGLKRIKLYFMIGLPTETDEDIAAIGDLVKKIKDRLLRSLRHKKLLPEITLTVSSFVPKPGTPFQLEPMLEISELKARARRLKASLKGVKGVRVHFDVPKWSYLQAVFSRGDRRVGTLIEALVQNDGDLNRALKQVAFNPDFFALRSMAEDELLPWSFLDHGFDPGYLASETDLAREGKVSPACLPESCRRCGICPV